MKLSHKAVLLSLAMSFAAPAALANESRFTSEFIFERLQNQIENFEHPSGNVNRTIRAKRRLARLLRRIERIHGGNPSPN